MSATVIRLEKLRMCDFCGKTERQVEVLIVAPNGVADICNECVDVCQQAIADSRQRKAEPVDATP